MRRAPARLPYLAWCALVILAAPFIVLGVLVRWVRGKGRAGLWQRLGGARIPAASGERLWVHACSVGEVAAAATIVQALRQRRPGLDVVLSVITAGGYEAGQRAGAFNHVCYAPLDLPGVARRFVDQVAPDVFVDIETELWPVMLYQVARLRVPMLLVHGRISDRSIRSYRRIRRGTRWMLGHFDMIMAQSRRDRDRFIELGAPGVRVVAAGNAKYDGAPPPLGAGEVQALRAAFRLGSHPAWVVGSTRVPAEERLVLAAFALARARVPALRLVLAPRHVTRVSEVLALAAEAGIDAAPAAAQREAACVVVDTMGILARLYAVGSVALVGNSLVAPGGGQNLIEPLAQGVPVLVGPFTREFADAVELAVEGGVAWRVDGAHAVADAVVGLVSTAPNEALRARAMALVAAQRGAAARYGVAIDDAFTRASRSAA